MSDAQFSVFTFNELAKRSHDPLGDELRARALAFVDEIVNEAGTVLVKGMRGELPGSDAREQRLCAQAIRAERIPSASSQPTVAPRIEVRIASFAQLASAPMPPRFASNANPQSQRGIPASTAITSTVRQQSEP
jgi:hypothetical protein